MEKHECPTCKGTKQRTIVAQVFTSEGFKPEPPVTMPCSNCKGTGFLTQEQIDKKAAEDAIWCKCEGHTDVTYHEDGSGKRYEGFIVNKHHYSCNQCGLIQQIG